MSGDAAIELKHVAKRYRGKVDALRGVSMRVEKGEVFGLLGPNGAGKSTLVKILMGIVRPTRCDGRLLGAPVGDKGVLARAGYLPEHLRFPDYLTGEQVLHYVGGLCKVPRHARRKRVGELLELVGMSDWASKRVGGYSKGMKQRVGIAQALINDPELVLLDEPTDGVDPVGRKEIRELLVRLRDEGRAVLVNSHLLGEVEMVTDRVAILVQGLVRAHGTLDEMTQGMRGYEIELADGDAGEAASSQDGLTRDDEGMRLPGGERVTAEDSTLRVDTDDPKPVQGVLDGLRAKGVVIRSMRPVRPSLEDLFISAVTDPETGQAYKPGASRKKRAGKAERAGKAGGGDQAYSGKERG